MMESSVVLFGATKGMNVARKKQKLRTELESPKKTPGAGTRRRQSVCECESKGEGQRGKGKGGTQRERGREKGIRGATAMTIGDKHKERSFE
jgi:hypothetical protein